MAGVPMGEACSGSLLVRTKCILLLCVEWLVLSSKGDPTSSSLSVYASEGQTNIPAVTLKDVSQMLQIQSYLHVGDSKQ
jgi:hypothetical protein